MKVYAVGTIDKSTENMAFYNRKGYKMTGETISIDYDFGESVTYVIFKGSWTRHQSVRDCGDHYIIACGSRYDRIDKTTWKIDRDVEDI